MKPPALFRSSDERDEMRWRIDHMAGVRRDLAGLSHDPELVDYRLTTAGSGVPILPSATELAQAQDVLRRVGIYLAHHYHQRCRFDDARLHRHAVDDPNPAEQDNDTPF